MELILRCSTSTDIRAIFVPCFVIQIGNILTSIISFAGSIPILIKNGQAAVVFSDIANFNSGITTNNDLAF